MRTLLLVLLAFVLGGCGEPSPAPEVRVPATAANKPAKEPLEPPLFDANARLALERRTGAVRVGETYGDALAVFAEPPGSFEKNDLPPSITEPYEARGWQNQTEGFGTILYRNRVAAAVYQAQDVTEDRLQDLIQVQQDHFRQPMQFLGGKSVRYWFWWTGLGSAAADQILMIEATELHPGKLNLTAAIGTAPIMQALGMTPDSADRDRANAELMIDKIRATKPNTPSSANRTGP